VPELRPSARGGRGLPHATGDVVRVTDDGSVEVLGPRSWTVAAGLARRAVLLDAAAGRRLLPGNDHYGGTVVLLGDTGPLLALQPLAWSPPTPVRDDMLLRTSGTTAFCAALGLPLEPVTRRDLAALTSAGLAAVLARPGPTTIWPGRATPALLLVAAVLGVVAVDLPELPRLAAATLALALAACILVPGLRGRLQAWRAGGPDAAGVVVRPRPAGPVARGLLSAELQVAPGRLLLRRHRQLVCLPGPARGGIVQAIVEPGLVRLCDSGGATYATLDPVLWCPDEPARRALVADLEAGGLVVLTSPVDSGVSSDLANGTHRHRTASSRLSAAERGDSDATTSRYAGIVVGVAAVGLGRAVEAGTGGRAAQALLVCAVLLAAAALGLGTARWWSDRAAARVVTVPTGDPAGSALARR
jgi:hypothetical protein